MCSALRCVCLGFPWASVQILRIAKQKKYAMGVICYPHLCIYTCLGSCVGDKSVVFFKFKIMFICVCVSCYAQVTAVLEEARRGH